MTGSEGRPDIATPGLGRLAFGPGRVRAQSGKKKDTGINLFI